jgi:hypothetical protein
MGLIGALFMGAIVFYINSDHGPMLATIAALKQGIYTFLIGGLILKVLEVIVKEIKQEWLAYACAIAVATLITVSLVYLVHSMKGTPKPFASTMPTIILAPIGFFYAARLKRKNKSIPRLGFRKNG